MERNWAKIVTPAMGIGVVVGVGLTLMWTSPMGIVIGAVAGLSVYFARYNFCCNPAQ